MKKLLSILLVLCFESAFAQKPIRIYSTYAESYAATQLQELLEKGGCTTTFGGKNTGHTIYVGLTHEEREKYRTLVDSLHNDGFFIVGDGRNVHLYGKGEKGTLYAVYSFLEMLGYRLYTPDAMVVPDVSLLKLPKCHVVSNPAFEYREVAYYYPNHSQLYADWHHLHTELDRQAAFGMFVHTFKDLLPPSKYYDSHPEWYSLNNRRRSRDGQLCLSNPEVLEALCLRLADTIVASPKKRIWSVSPNDNYNVCECDTCKRLDSLYGGPTGTLLHFVNHVARRFPDKTISTLAYQYTRKAPGTQIKPDSNVLVMLCPIEVGRQAPIMQSDPSFHKDMEDWSQLTDNIFMWDYVVQFRNFWNPFPNLHVLQPNLQYFRDHGVKMMFEQATGADNITSWMDIRCYMIAKLLWNPDADMDSVMADFYQGYYGDAGRYVKEIIDTMTTALVQSGRRLDIYGYPVDGDYFDPDNSNVGYLYPTKMEQYYDLMRKAEMTTTDTQTLRRLHFFRLALDFAHLEICYGDPTYEEIMQEIDRLEHGLQSFGVPQMMEMGCSPAEYAADMRHWADKVWGTNLAYGWKDTFRKNPTAPYNQGNLTDGEIGIMDYRHHWLGFWGDTLDAIIDLGDTTAITTVSLDFYFYPLSWIFLPKAIAVFFSNDGETWYRLAFWHDIQNPEVLAIPSIKNFTFNSYDWHRWYRARYLRIIAVPLDEIPAWHRAAGQKPWIFTDEIIVK